MSATPIRVGSYQLGERIGQGGSAEVYAARDRSGRNVAIKLLGPHAELDDERASARFAREIELLAGLSHPNLVHLLDSGRDPELGPFLVTELVTGASLRDHLGVGPDLAALLAAPIAFALSTLASAGLIHRDLKPENILLTDLGRPVLIDLGLAIGPGYTRFTEEGEVTGSLPYMAPEQIEGAEIDSAADVWALGVVLYELIAGRRPFARERASEEVAAILAGRYSPIESRDERVAPVLAQLIAGCLSRAPSARPSAADAAALLAQTIDWCPPERHDGERRRYLEDPDAVTVAIASARIESLRADAGGAGRRPLDAVRDLSRALAYAPSDETLAAEVRAISAAPPAAAAPRQGTKRHTMAAISVVGALAIAAVVLAFVPNEGDHTLLAGLEARVSEPVPPTSVVDHLTDAIVGDLPEGSRSDVAAKRVAGGMLALFGRSIAGGPDASGKLVAASGSPGSRSNEELTLDVVGGMVDLFEEGMAAKREPAKAEVSQTSIKLAAPPNLRDDDAARSLDHVRAGEGETLLLMPGKSPAELRAVLAEIRRRQLKDPENPELRLIEATYRLALGDKSGLAALAAVIKSNPSLSVGHFLAARVAMRQGDLAAALEAAERGLALEKDSAVGYAIRGRARFFLGQTRAAYLDLRRAVLADNFDPMAIAALAELYAAVGEDAGAAALVSQLQALTLDGRTSAVATYHLAALCRLAVAAACTE